MTASASRALPLAPRSAPEPTREASDLAGGRTGTAPLSLVGAMKCVRRTVAEFSELPIDAIVSCERVDAGWEAVVDLLEAPARLGDNDMLGSYRVNVSITGEPIGFVRQRRYRREEGGA